ncbi:secretin and TonB N-terminal domain-containing protein [Phocaeicola coprocola]
MRNFSKAILVASAALCLNLSAFSQNVSFSVQNVTVKEAMEQLKKTSGYSFVFSSSDVDTSKKVSVSGQNSSIQDIIQQILQGQNGLDYEIQGKKIIVKKIGTSNSLKNQKRILASGKVLDVNGEPIIGATVLEKGTSNGTITAEFNLQMQQNSD